MVACLEKSDKNSEFHHIVDFLSTCSINYALTIHAKVNVKAVVISESLVRNDLFFDDEDGITCLTNDEIFENLTLIGRTKKDTELPHTSVPLDHGPDKAIHKEGGNSMVRAITTDASLDATQDSDIISKTQSMATLTEPTPQDEGSVNTVRSGEANMEPDFELTDSVPPTPHDLPLPRGYTPGSDEGRLKLEELMNICTILSKQVLDLEKEKDAQAMEILRLKKRVKRLERKRKSSTSQ
ncbi:hypothetical protein Tco_1543924, partial [Tanacetum coccineum]